MNSICLVFDRLHAGYLGAYGNNWIETPEFDELAGQSFLFDQALIDSPRLESLYRSLWQGWHAMLGPAPADRPTLAKLLGAAGTRTILLTDEPEVAGHPLTEQFDELVEIERPSEVQMADAVEDTHLAQCYTQILETIQSAPQPFFLWCHLSALGTAWDAPLEFRERYLEDEEDPEPSESAEVPNRMLPEDYDPDELLRTNRSYAGQVTLLDACLGALLEFLNESGLATQSLLALTSARGFPLGEHRRLGPCDEALYGPLVHVPLLLRFPDGRGAAARGQALVQTSDLWATLLDFHGVPDRPESPSGRSLLGVVDDERAMIHDRVCIAGSSSETAIRTPAWYLRAAAEAELYAKPDDRWEANDVARRCRDVVESLQAAIVQYRAALAAGRAGELPPLEEVLMKGMS